MSQLTDFGKRIKKKLVDIEKSQAWLIEEIRSDTGLFVDGAYLRKIMLGQRKAPLIISSICRILDIEPPADSKTA